MAIRLTRKLLGKLKRSSPRGQAHALDAASILRDSGLFDEPWYRAQCPDASADIVAHYLSIGAAAGVNPCYLFDARWYLAHNPDVAQSGMNPLLHYVVFGEAEGRAPSPVFDPTHYRAQLPAGAASGRSLLAHFIEQGHKAYAPNSLFHPSPYLAANPDLAKAGVDPLRHYLHTGWREDREPNARYSLKSYGALLRARHGQDIEPLSYFLSTGRDAGDLLPVKDAPLPVGSGEALRATLDTATSQGPFFEQAQNAPTSGARALQRARAFAFYLPQFHPIPQNDAWWGEGFTEWRNVARAQPRFPGHIQPRLPRDLGYYDLRVPAVLQRQVEMARRAGLAGFCFYYYWFNGQRLLERPLEEFLGDADLDFPFCLMWANENWTRRWDGLDQEILIQQDYRDEDDAALVSDLVRHFRDPRYERVDGRPLFFLYRPGIIPNARERIARWRELFASHGETPLLLMAQGFGDTDPRPFGLDGAVEFPPHKLAQDLPRPPELEPFEGHRFAGHYFRYADLVSRSLSEGAPAFDLIKTAVPSWDNEARKPGRGMGFTGATPAAYERWLSALVERAVARPLLDSTPYVFINAWNEWAEGAYLEPDVHHGSAYLNATFRAVTGLPREQAGGRLLLVGHDAQPHGAQLLTLNLLRTLKRRFGVEVTCVLLEGGSLLADYQAEGETVVASERGLPLEDLLGELAAEQGIHHALCNTVVTGAAVRALALRGVTTVSLVHELSQLIRSRGLEGAAADIAQHAHKVVFASGFVQRSFEQLAGSLGDRACLLPQGVYQKVHHQPELAGSLRERLGIPERARVVLNMGYGDLRKGFDLFVQLAQQVCARHPDAHFVWLGPVAQELRPWLSLDLERALRGRFHVLPFEADVGPALNGADVFALTSREDPFPSVVMEALVTGLPVVAFEGGGGYADLLAGRPLEGSLCPHADVAAMAEAVLQRLETETADTRTERAERAHDAHGWEPYVWRLLEMLRPDLRKVSVIVPNYNYARYLPDRLRSVFRQEYPVYEVIVLDDCSTDDSVRTIHEVAGAAGRDVRVVVNEQNSGSVFRQWQKGLSLAQGEWVWMAEADDACTPRFLPDLVASLSERSVLGFCDSAQVDQEGHALGQSYNFYYQDLPGNPLSDSVVLDGRDFIQRALAIKNVILNASAVVFRRSALDDAFRTALDEVTRLRMAGDWRLYCELLSKPGSEITYCARPHNIHRRHAVSVTHSLDAARHVREIQEVQQAVARLVEVPEASAKRADAHLDDVRQRLLGGT